MKLLASSRTLKHNVFLGKTVKMCLLSNRLHVKFLSFHKTRCHPDDICGSHSVLSHNGWIRSSLCESPKSGVASSDWYALWQDKTYKITVVFTHQFCTGINMQPSASRSHFSSYLRFTSLLPRSESVTAWDEKLRWHWGNFFRNSCGES